ncbi:uncharacterized protein LOC126907876 isoform X2 [Daktulosphaira vitifoliae]|uniref:uncharacterized protein LOC126907876 isoform X2 n=1 Tax=Daktulosphaira vitifoliae TaxID=58002 RepID=UPI0021AB00B6|nr:uncharacterized protein LOC126907876 isoform X2 [Daktulosphaira vitifoliae]
MFVAKNAWSSPLPQFYQTPSLQYRPFYRELTPFFFEDNFRQPIQFYQTPTFAIPPSPSSSHLPPSPPSPSSLPFPPQLQSIQQPSSSFMLNQPPQSHSTPTQVTNVHHHIYYYYYLPAQVESRLLDKPRTSERGQIEGRGVGVDSSTKKLCNEDDGVQVIASPPIYLPPDPAPPTQLPVSPSPPTQAPCDDTIIVESEGYFPFGRSSMATNKNSSVINISASQKNAQYGNIADKRKIFVPVNFLLPPDNK